MTGPRPISDSFGPLVDRRAFLQTGAVAAAGLATFTAAGGAHAAMDETITVGLIGCGGRGTGAALNAIKADKNVKLVAMADAFADRLQDSLAGLKKAVPDQVAVPPERQHIGFDAYKQLIDSDVDVVILATSPHFRPAHLRKAVEAGKHIFCEKPVAVDAPGVRSVMESVELAKQKKLSLVSGLCYRYDKPKVELYKKIHDGAIGDIQAMHVSYNTGGIWVRERQPQWTDMEWQMRNWAYFTWLSGDHIVEQAVHSLDKAAWAMKDETPVNAIGLGGRQVRVDPKFGHIFDHHAVVYEYAGGQRMFAFCRQQAGCQIDVSDHLIGTQGTAEVMKHAINSKNGNWTYRGKKPSMYQEEHDALFRSIRNGEARNDGDYMTKSTMLAILGRMAAYTGQRITWQDAMASKEDLSPPKYDWNISLSVPPVAMPGVTTFA